MITTADTQPTARRHDSEARRLAVELIAHLLEARSPLGLRRDAFEPLSDSDLVFQFGDYCLDPRYRRVTRNGSQIVLPLREYELLVALATRAGAPVSKELLREEVWRNRIDSESRSIDQHVSELRKKLGANVHDSPIVTVRKYGYALSGEWIQRTSRK